MGVGFFKKFVVLAIVFLAGASYIEAQPGVLTPPNGVPTDQALRSMADWYTMKVYKPSVLTGVTTVSTTWSLLQCKAIYNNRRDSSRTVQAITAAGDTVKVSVAAESASMKLPILVKLIAAGSQDSVYLMMQSR